MPVITLITVAMIAFSPCAVAWQTAPTAPAPAPALTPAQREMLKTAETEQTSKFAPFAEKIGRASKELNRVILASNPDPQAEQRLTEDLTKAVADVVSEAIRARVVVLRTFVGSLSPDQKAALLAAVDDPRSDADLMKVIQKVFK